MHKSTSSSSLGPGGLDLSKTFFTPIDGGAPSSPTKRHTKITVVGVGNVGMAIAQTIITQDLTDEITLVDAKEDKLRGEVLDLQHAAAFLPRVKINASLDYAATAHSDLCIVTAGARQNPGESRLNLLHRNVALYKHIIPPLAKFSPDCIILVVSNPVDVLTYIAWKLSGFPANRVIGSGTNLDSSRFRFLIADHLDVNAQDVQAYIVGEHGDSSVALWSSISVGGVPVLSFLERQQIAYEKETLENIHKEVVQGAYEVIRLKGYTSWAIGYSVASLARSLLRNQRRIHPVSVLAKGFYGIDGGEVFLSLPAQLGRNGILGVTNVHLTDEECEQLRNSAKTILEEESVLEADIDSNVEERLLSIFGPNSKDDGDFINDVSDANNDVYEESDDAEYVEGIGEASDDEIGEEMEYDEGIMQEGPQRNMKFESREMLFVSYQTYGFSVINRTAQKVHGSGEPKYLVIYCCRARNGEVKKLPNE
ncbi:Lactate/malate dehydrogenase family protein [Perilla frutescens var. frutescens]|nr:Lactate/malate dehydrogenase family protein [Perilla frutescens var. frutescens]